MSDWLDSPLIWIYLAVCVAALRGVTSGVTQAMLPRALAADGSGNTTLDLRSDLASIDILHAPTLLRRQLLCRHRVRDARRRSGGPVTPI